MPAMSALSGMVETLEAVILRSRRGLGRDAAIDRDRRSGVADKNCRSRCDLILDTPGANGDDGAISTCVGR
jgi:hypothetical protein